jgi:serine/threonine protein kinase
MDTTIVFLTPEDILIDLDAQAQVLAHGDELAFAIQSYAAPKEPSPPTPCQSTELSFVEDMIAAKEKPEEKPLFSLDSVRSLPMDQQVKRFGQFRQERLDHQQVSPIGGAFLSASFTHLSRQRYESLLYMEKSLQHQSHMDFSGLVGVGGTIVEAELTRLLGEPALYLGEILFLGLKKKEQNHARILEKFLSREYSPTLGLQALLLVVLRRTLAKDNEVLRNFLQKYFVPPYQNLLSSKGLDRALNEVRERRNNAAHAKKPCNLLSYNDFSRLVVGHDTFGTWDLCGPDPNPPPSHQAVLHHHLICSLLAGGSGSQFRGLDLSVLRQMLLTWENPPTSPLLLRLRPLSFSQPWDGQGWLNQPEPQIYTFQPRVPLYLEFWANQDCYFTLLYVSSQGEVSVLFPHPVQTLNFLPGMKIHCFPDPSQGGVQFQSGLEQGVETLILLGTFSPLNLPGTPETVGQAAQPLSAPSVAQILTELDKLTPENWALARCDFEIVVKKHSLSTIPIIYPPPQPPPPGNLSLALNDHVEIWGLKFRVVEVRTGGMGIFYKLTETCAGMHLALKTFIPDAGQKLMKGFVREAEIWIRFGSHPNLVRALGVEKINRQLFLILEFVEPHGDAGLTLAEWIAQGVIQSNLPLGMDLAIQICNGMIFANEKFRTIYHAPFVHRDLKPSNILMGCDHNVKISDFGCAPYETEIVGTLPYMAPEVWKGEEVDERTDVYAFGCLLHEMLVGRTPFLAKDRDAWREAHLSGLPEGLPQFSKNLQEIIFRCLKKPKEIRFLDFGEVRESLVCFYGDHFGPLPEHLKPLVMAPTALDVLQEGLSLEKLDRPNDALFCYSAALDLNPNNPEAYYLRGRAYKNLRLYKESVRDFSQALEHEPKMARAYLERGLVYRNLGMHEKAKEDFGKFIKMATAQEMPLGRILQKS